MTRQGCVTSEYLEQSGAHLCRRPGYMHPSILQSRNLLLSPALTTGDDGASVAHTTTRGRSKSRDERHHRFGIWTLWRETKKGNRYLAPGNMMVTI